MIIRWILEKLFEGLEMVETDKGSCELRTFLLAELHARL
jgi:hypothetical protein